MTSVEIEDPPATMIVGHTQVLQASVYPDDAADQRVAWSSGDETIATVNPDTGLLTAQKAGITWIYATAKDGSGSYGVFTLEVKKPSVTVMKDGDYHKVVFNETGKVWRCIGRDLIYNASGVLGDPYIDRSNQNFYAVYNQELKQGSEEKKQYSDDEIKVLYAIDPHGVAHYVYRHAMHISSKYRGNEVLKKNLQYKDEIFEVLFRRKPKYFKRNEDARWVRVYNPYEYENMTPLVSESETIFGFHQNRDGFTLAAFLDAAFAIIQFGVAAVVEFTVPSEKAQDQITDICELATDIVKFAILAYCEAEYNFFESVIEISTDIYDLLKTEVEDPLLELLDTVKAYIDIIEALQHYLEVLEEKPNYFKKVLYYYANNLPYDIHVEGDNQQKFNLKDIEIAMS